MQQALLPVADLRNELGRFLHGSKWALVMAELQNDTCSLRGMLDENLTHWKHRPGPVVFRVSAEGKHYYTAVWWYREQGLGCCNIYEARREAGERN